MWIHHPVCWALFYHKAIRDAKTCNRVIHNSWVTPWGAMLTSSTLLPGTLLWPWSLCFFFSGYFIDNLFLFYVNILSVFVSPTVLPILTLLSVGKLHVKTQLSLMGQGHQETPGKFMYITYGAPSCEWLGKWTHMTWNGCKMQWPKLCSFEVYLHALLEKSDFRTRQI